MHCIMLVVGVGGRILNLASTAALWDKLLLMHQMFVSKHLLHTHSYHFPLSLDSLLYVPLLALTSFMHPCSRASLTHMQPD